MAYCIGNIFLFYIQPERLQLAFYALHHFSDLLLQGNVRFVHSASIHHQNHNDRRRELRDHQRPFAIILSCSDSRVPAEIIFDCGLGDLFVVRTAGHTLDKAVLGTIEFGISVLKAPLLVVLGHQNCGAVEAALHG